MASIMFGGGVSAIRGSIAGQTFSKNANGAYIRNRSKPANTNTIAQQGVRNTFGAIARTWKDLSEAEQQSFIDQAASYPYVNRLGESSVYTGFQLYQKINAALQLIGESAIRTLIPPVTLPATERFDTPTFDLSLTKIGFVTAWLGAGSVPADTVCVVNATRMYSNGTYRPKRQDFKQISVEQPSTDMNAENFWSAYASVYGAPSTVGNFMFMSINLVSTLTGQTTASQELRFTLSA